MNPKFDLQGWAVSLAQCLPGWSYVKPPDDNDHWRDEVWAKLQGEGDMRITLHYDTHKKRVAVHGDYPQESGSTWPDRKDRPDSITVSVERPAADVAKDMTRRFVSAYMEAHKKGIAQWHEYCAYQDKIERLVKQFADMCVVEPRGHSIHVFPDNVESKGYFDLTVDSPTSVRIDIRSLPVERAKSVVKILVS